MLCSARLVLFDCSLWSLWLWPCLYIRVQETGNSREQETRGRRGCGQRWERHMRKYSRMELRVCTSVCNYSQAGLIPEPSVVAVLISPLLASPDRASSATLLGTYPAGVWAVLWECILLGDPCGNQSPERQLIPNTDKTISASAGSREEMATSSNTHRCVFQGMFSDFYRQKQSQECFREQKNIFLEQFEFPLLH